MTQMITVSIKIPEELRDRAHDLGICISRISRKAVEDAVTVRELKIMNRKQGSET